MSTSNVGLQVDPNLETISMTQVDPGAAGQSASAMAEQVAKYGEAYINKAIDRGWTPADGDAKEYVKTHAAPAAGADAAFMAEMAALKQKIDRIEQVSREDLEAQYTDLIAKAKTPVQVQKLMKQMNDQIAREFGPAAVTTKPAPPVQMSAELIAFQSKWKPKMTGAEGAALRAFGDAKFAELRTQFPAAPEAQIIAALDKELEGKFGGTGQRTREVPLMANGSGLPDGGNTGKNDFGGPVTPATMTGDLKQAFAQLQSMGVYKVSGTGREERLPGGGVKAYASEADALKAYLQGVNKASTEGFGRDRD